MTPTTRMPATLAIDIGGANTKAAWLRCNRGLRTVSRPFEIWRDREALSVVLREVAAEVAADAVAITMTAELSDAFRTKREGVEFVLDAAEAALGDRPLSVLTRPASSSPWRRRARGRGTSPPPTGWRRRSRSPTPILTRC